MFHQLLKYTLGPPVKGYDGPQWAESSYINYNQEMLHTYVYRLIWSRQFYKGDSPFPDDSRLYQVDNLMSTVTDHMWWLVFIDSLIKFRMPQEISEVHLWMCL